MTLKKPTDFFSDGEDENNTINGDVSNIDELIKKPELKFWWSAGVAWVLLYYCISTNTVIQPQTD